MSVPKYTREIPQRYRLEAAKCQQCGKILFPPRRVCPQCGNETFDTVRLPDRGKVVTFTVIRVAPKEFAQQAPYIIGIIELENGVRLTSQIVDCSPEEVSTGKNVEMVFRKIQEEGKAGLICYGYKCRLVL